MSEFVVDKVSDSRIRNGERVYKTHWAGVDSKGNPWPTTWEPAEHFFQNDDRWNTHYLEYRNQLLEESFETIKDVRREASKRVRAARKKGYDEGVRMMNSTHNLLCMRCSCRAEQ